MASRIVALHHPLPSRMDLLRCPVLAIWMRLVNTTQSTQSHGAEEEEGQQRHPGNREKVEPDRVRAELLARND